MEKKLFFLGLLQVANLNNLRLLKTEPGRSSNCCCVVLRMPISAAASVFNVEEGGWVGYFVYCNTESKEHSRKVKILDVFGTMTCI